MTTVNMASLIIIAAPVWIAPAVSAAVAALKASPFPYQGATKAGIVAALAVAALVLRLGLAWATGDLASLDVTHEAQLVIDAIAAAGVAAGVHAIARDEKPSI